MHNESPLLFWRGKSKKIQPKLIHFLNNCVVNTCHLKAFFDRKMIHEWVYRRCKKSVFNEKHRILHIFACHPGTGAPLTFPAPFRLQRVLRKPARASSFADVSFRLDALHCLCQQEGIQCIYEKRIISIYWELGHLTCITSFYPGKSHLN